MLFWMIAMAAASPMINDLDWFVVNDTVMGGVSSSTVEVEDTLVFTGELSLERNGGFTSVRSRPGELSLDGVRALRVTLRGDGRFYDLTLERSDVPLRAGSYRVTVGTVDAVTVMEIPLADFRPTSFGRPVSGAPALDAAPERIDSLGFLLGDKNPGPFELEVIAIEPIPGAAPRGDTYPAVISALEEAVSRGVPAFNAGDVARCATIYAEALESALAEDGLTPGERGLVSDALSAANGLSPGDAAWTLRYAIDSVLRSAPRVSAVR